MIFDITLNTKDTKEYKICFNNNGFDRVSVIDNVKPEILEALRDIINMAIASCGGRVTTFVPSYMEEHSDDKTSVKFDEGSSIYIYDNGKSLQFDVQRDIIKVRADTCEFNQMYNSLTAPDEGGISILSKFLISKNTNDIGNAMSNIVYVDAISRCIVTNNPEVFSIADDIVSNVIGFEYTTHGVINIALASILYGNVIITTCYDHGDAENDDNCIEGLTEMLNNFISCLGNTPNSVTIINVKPDDYLEWRDKNMDSKLPFYIIELSKDGLDGITSTIENNNGGKIPSDILGMILELFKDDEDDDKKEKNDDDED